MKKYILVGLVVIAAISLAGCSTNSTSSTTPTPTTVAASPTTTETAVSTDTYKDGDYDATGNYVSPGGAEEIEIKVTLKDNVITDATAISKAFRPESKNYQGQFVDGFKSQVIGKNINEVNLTKVSGSSLTSKGFNDAISKIKAEAKI